MPPLFKYTAKNKSGKVISGKSEGETPINVARKVKKEGYYIINIEKVEKKKEENKLNINLFRKKVNQKDLLTFTKQFYTMLASGLSILDSLIIIEEQSTKNNELQKVIREIKEDIEKGSSLFNSISKKNDVFPYFYQQMIRIGEKAGVLAQILKDLTLYYSWKLEFRKKVISSLYYPLLLLLASVIAIFILLKFVIPSFVEIFSSFEATLPLPTRFILHLSQNSIKYFSLIIFILTITILLIKYIYNSEKGGNKIAYFILKIPYLGRLRKDLIFWRFSNNLALLTKNGLSLLDALSIIEEITKDKVMKKIIYNLEIDIREGKNLSYALKEKNFFPKIMFEFIKTGEKTGQLANMLFEIAKYFKNDLEDKMKSLVVLLEPTLILFLAAIIAFIAIAVILPLFNMYSLF
ncbi:MAG: type II secretion system F family protein [Bacillota bacterium]